MMNKRQFPISRRAVIQQSIGLGAALSMPACLAEPQQRSIYVPTAGDVCFSSRTIMPDSFAVAERIGATRLDWTYSQRRDFLSAARVSGLKFVGGAINMCPPDGPGKVTYQIGRQLSLDGSFIEAPWMKGMGWYWGCVNNPEFMALQLGRAMRSLNAGADYIQFDDAGGSIPAVSFGGCWCSYCVKSAKAQGLDLSRDMLAFQTRSTKKFITQFRENLDRAMGNRITISCNNYRLKMDDVFSLFDYGMCEIDPIDASLDNLLKFYNFSGRINWMQVVTLRSCDPSLNRATIAAVHALGGAMIYPWDVYIAPGQARCKGNHDDYKGIYSLISRSKMMLIGSRFCDKKSEDFFSAETQVALERAGVKILVRSFESKTVVHLIPPHPTKRYEKIICSLKGLSKYLIVDSSQGCKLQEKDSNCIIDPREWTVMLLDI